MKHTDIVSLEELIKNNISEVVLVGSTQPTYKKIVATTYINPFSTNERTQIETKFEVYIEKDLVVSTNDLITAIDYYNKERKS